MCLSMYIESNGCGQDGGYGDDRTMMSLAFCKWKWKCGRVIA